MLDYERHQRHLKIICFVCQSWGPSPGTMNIVLFQEVPLTAWTNCLIAVLYWSSNLSCETGGRRRCDGCYTTQLSVSEHIPEYVVSKSLHWLHRYLLPNSMLSIRFYSGRDYCLSSTSMIPCHDRTLHLYHTTLDYHVPGMIVYRWLLCCNDEQSIQIDPVFDVCSKVQFLCLKSAGEVTIHRGDYIEWHNNEQ